MRYITVPNPVTILNADGAPVPRPDGSPWAMTFADFVKGTLLNDTKWGVSSQRIRMSVKIEAALDKPGHLAIDDAWHEALVEVLDAPTSPYVPLIAKQLISFFDAIADARSEP